MSTPTKLKVETRTITPQEAGRLLRKNRVNRALNPMRVAAYAADMHDDKWVLNGETLVLGPNNEVMSGQHRLTACVQADKPFTTLVATGVNGDAMATLDSGASRSLADVLTLQGYSHRDSVSIASAAKWLTRYDTMIAKGTNQLPPINDHSNNQLLQVLVDDPAIIYSVEQANQWAKTTPAPKSVIAFVHALTTRHYGPEQADRFFTELADASGDPDGPANVVRRTLLNHQIGAARLNAFTQAAMLVKAVRAEIQGRKPQKIMWKRKTALYAAEPFPRIDEKAK